ncbi:hypothetical protein FBU30_001211 [Linnemannia zychae]|nr:hypothetical protein FBU30_001211 [Linnemannia zychae]
MELVSVEPYLRGVTPLALLSLYERIIKERKALDAFLSVATGYSWTDIRMSEMAVSLIKTGRELRDRENRQQASKSDAKKQAASKTQTIEREVVITMPGTLAGRKRAIQEEESDEDADVVDGDNTFDADLQQSSVVHPASALATMDTQLNQNQSTGDSSNTQINPQQREHPLTVASSRLSVKSRCQSTASESMESDSISSALERTSTFAQPTSRFKRFILATVTDKLAALVSRVDELEIQNHQLRMELLQLTIKPKVHRQHR